MKISILIAAYHAGDQIAPALASIAAQTHADWELIVVEDGSRDQTEQLVTEFGCGRAQAVVYHNLGANRGVAEARNELMRRATGEAMAFIDADDLWEPEHLAVAAAALEGGADIVVADVRAFDLATGDTVKLYPLPAEVVSDPVDALLAGSPIVTCSAVVLRSQLARSVGDFDPQLRVGEDRDFWLRAALLDAKFARGRPTCHYAKHLGSTMSRTLLVAEQIVLFQEKYFDFPRIPPRRRRHALADALVVLGRLTRATDPHRSAACFWRAWQLRPLSGEAPVHWLLSLVLSLRR